MFEYQYAASNYLELYTTTVAWNVYGTFWEAFVTTGLIYIPLLHMMFIAINDAYEKGNADEYVDQALLGFFIKVLTIMIVVLPTLEASRSNMKFTSYACSADNDRTATSSYLNGDTSAYSQTPSGMLIMNQSSVKVPIWWAFWNAISHGVTDAATASLPCKVDVRALANDVSATQITDPLLRGEVSHFYRACWRPSISEFYRKSPDIPANIKDIATDISWPGSQFFMQTPGYYDFYRAIYPLKSFPYDESRDGAIVKKEFAEGGYPDCDDWWQDSERGLKKRLLDEFPLGVMDKLSVYFTNPTGSFPSNTALARSMVEDAVLREKLSGDRAIQGSIDNISSLHLSGDGGVPLDFMQNLFTSAGLAVESAMHYTKLRMIKQLAPVVQSILLMVFIMVLPALYIIGDFEIEGIIAATVFYFSVVFWGFLFELANWIDSFLLEGAAFGGSLSVSDPSASITGLMRESNFTWAVDFLTSALYVVLPVIMTMFIGMVAKGPAKEMSETLGNWTKSASGAAGKGPGAVKEGAK